MHPQEDDLTANHKSLLITRTKAKSQIKVLTGSKLTLEFNMYGDYIIKYLAPEGDFVNSGKSTINQDRSKVYGPEVQKLVVPRNLTVLVKVNGNFSQCDRGSIL